MLQYRDRFIKFISVICIVLLTGCQPNDADFDDKVNEFKLTEVGADLVNKRFVPPYSSLDPLLEYTAWCNSVLWAQLSIEENSVELAFLREDIFALASPEVVGFFGVFNELVVRSGGVDAIYPYIHGDAAYLMKPSRLAMPIIKKMLNSYQRSASFKKAIELSKKRPKRSKSFTDADTLCFKADMLTGILGGESRSRNVISEVSELVRKNTLASQ
ncbi:hypothetical protein Sbal625DRAFT_3961 [Shewanella baltica OS625]|uniref:Uncharacterized protein n=2 Tax=Shewanella baltica TaxID=62322 RepID=A9KUU2_SHEB9|nr:hypothetical protein Sbal195_2181 [Shewanella baltica OS195]ABX50110.1 hypothetical protein Sbal195_2944 [Shewanella baltica OS195]ADT95103.1 hypothetical protein Sbal678_2954 [Shewanella baltica OS678]EHC04372.1 hypothetical protein Sbal625DRAFT_3961 [Shewanella baltica OS625]